MQLIKAIKYHEWFVQMAKDAIPDYRNFREEPILLRQEEAFLKWAAWQLNC